MHVCPMLDCMKLYDSVSLEKGVTNPNSTHLVKYILNENITNRLFNQNLISNLNVLFLNLLPVILEFQLMFQTFPSVSRGPEWTWWAFP